MNRLLLPCVLALSTAAVALPAMAAEEANLAPVSTFASQNERAAVEWSAPRMEHATPAPRSGRSAPKE